jgi:peptidoglycan hydrolase-like protein with peptidoglycan-binding domain
MFLVVGINQVRAESSCPFDQEMGLGTENSKVGVLQSFMLNTLKIYSGPVTNYFGPLTMASVKIFQESSGLLQTGKVDLITANSLCKIYLSYKTSEPLNTGSGECFIKTLGIQKGYFEEANEEVKNLQLYLNQKGYYPENVISGYFGIKTEAALKAFQKANNISQSGIIDDITFKVICGYESNQSSYCPFVTDNLSIGYFEEANNEVKALQMILSKLSLLEEKNITGYFGKITSEAVKSMQSKVGLISTGVLNLETRQALCKMINLPLKGESSGNPYESSNSNIDVTISDVGVLPDKIDVNTKTAIVIKIKNIGSEDSKAIKSSLYINDKEINKTNVSVIKPNDEVIAIVQN